MTETEQAHPLIAPLLALIREVRAEKAAHELTAARRVTNSTATLVREAGEQARDCDNRIWDLKDLLKARLVEVRAQPAPELPDPAIAAISAAIPATEAALADQQRLLSRALGAMAVNPGDAKAATAVDEAASKVAATQQELSGLRQALVDITADDSAAKKAAQQKGHALRIAAVREVNNRDCVLVGQFEKLWAQIETLLTERAVMQREASELYFRAVQPLAGERFITQPALHLGANRIGFLEDIEALILAHQHDALSPLEATRRHADRISDVLDEELARTNNKGAFHE